MKKGNTFKIKPEWCDSKTEAALSYTCIGVNYETGIIYGKTFDTGFSLVPTEKFELRMINQA